MSWNLIQWSEQTSNIMATMTYKELLEELKQLNEEQLNKNVAVYDEHLDAKCLAHNKLIFFDNNRFPYIKI